MTISFKCKSCGLVFDAEARVKEYQHPLYGPCSTEVADCPACLLESPVFVKQKPLKTKSSLPPCGANTSCSGCMH